MSIKYFEGLVGRRYHDIGFAITSPNMKVLPPRIFGMRNVHMLRDYHFGLDDPLHHPQPFDSRVAHLALIPHPPQSHQQQVLWVVPSDAQFVALDRNSPLQSLGHLQLEWRQLLKGEYLKVKKRLGELRSTGPSTVGEKNPADDSILKGYNSRVQSLLARLELPGSLNDSVMLWCLIQRTVLEMDARLAWVSDVRKVYHARIQMASKVVVRDVVGALTDDMDVAECLFLVSNKSPPFFIVLTYKQCGIPVWLLRKIDAVQDVRVLTWLDDMAEEELPARPRGVSLSYDEAIPPHPVIFVGQAGSLERYRQMAVFIRKLTSTER